MKQLALLVGMCLVLFGCKQKQENLSESKELKAEKPVTVSGQVFIVTKGRENVRLALVLVRAYDNEAYSKAVTMAKARREAHILHLEVDTKAADAEIERLKQIVKEKESVLENVDKEIAKDTSLLGRLLVSETLEYKLVIERRNIMQEEKDKALAEVQDTMEKVGSAAAKVADNARKLQKTENEFLVEGLNTTPIAEAKSDVDGKFQLKLKPGSYYFVATASRSLSEKEETYYWFVPQTVGSEDIALLLSNDNLEK